MDITELAGQSVNILAPYLPYLIKFGEEAGKAAAKKLGEQFSEAGFDRAKNLWEKWRGKVEAKPATLEAANDVAAHPADPDAQAALRQQFKKILADDPGLTDQIALIIGQVGDRYIASGDRSVAGKTFLGPVETGDKQYIENYFASPGTPVALETLSAQELVAAYLRALAVDCAQLPLGIAMDFEFKSKAGEGSVRTPDIYVPLKVTPPAREEKFLKRLLSRETPAEGPAEPIEITGALARADLNRVVLIGEMGSGKSTFVDYIAFVLCQLRLGASNFENPLAPNSPLAPLFPIRFVLRCAARAIPANTAHGTAAFLWDALRTDLKTRFSEPVSARLFDELEKRVLQEPALILLDGLDEVRESEHIRERLVESIGEFVKPLPTTSRVVVTARPYAYSDKWHLPGFNALNIAPFDDEQIQEFIQRFYDLVRPVMRWDERMKDSKAGELREGVQRSDLADLATRPLLLTMMATLSSSRGKLPDDRFDLYDGIVGLLLNRWQSQRTEKNPDGTYRTDLPIAVALATDEKEIRKALYKLAFSAHDRQRQKPGDSQEPADISEEEVLAAFASILRGHDPNIFLLYIHDRAGLLIDRGRGIFAFPHRSFQEYLAALHFMAQPDPTSEIEKTVRQAPRWWREVFLWSAGISAIKVPSNAVRFLDALLPTFPHSLENLNESNWLVALLAALSYSELLVKQHSELIAYHVFNQLTAKLKDWLVALIETSKLTPRERAEAGNALARLDDPRRGVGVRDGLPDLVWCEIPAGDFTMGGDGEYEGKSQFPYTKIRAPYFISRYPITNAQFDVFLNDSDGFENKKWWNGLAQCDNTAKPPKQGGVYDLSNHPVVNVTWYQSVAFTRWLTAKSQESGFKLQVWRNDHVEPLQLPTSNVQLQIRLPTEAEWEKAARGTDRRIYPWNADIDPNRANYRDTGIGATSAVGCFPDGKSPYDVLDMSGNVWEWCATKWVGAYKDYDKKPEDRETLEGSDTRVLRGGSWDDGSYDVRAAYRGRDRPDGRLTNHGFRVVVRPFDSGL